MIQRIQSIYLLVATAAFGSFFGLPLAMSATTPAVTPVPQLADGQLNLYDNIGLLGLTCLGAILTFVAIFLYKNRNLQGKIASMAIISGILLLVLSGITAQGVRGAMNDVSALKFGFGWAAPVLAIVFSYLASRGIRADEQKVRSMDRLR